MCRCHRHQKASENRRTASKPLHKSMLTTAWMATRGQEAGQPINKARNLQIVLWEGSTVAACCSMLQHESHHINSLRSLCHLLICIHNFHNWLRTFSSSSTRRASANSLSWQELCPMFPDVSRCFCLVYDEHSTILYEYTVVNSIVLSESTIPCESYSNICVIELSWLLSKEV